MVRAHDVILIGLSADIAGALLLAKSVVSKTLQSIRDESTTYVGRNLFAVKSGYHLRAEALAGASLLSLGFLVQIIGNLRILEVPGSVWFTSWLGLCALVSLVAVLFLFGIVFSRFVARRQFLRYVSRSPKQPKPFNSEQRQDRKKLEADARLLGMKIKPGESNDELADRLDQLRLKLWRKHGGRLKIT